MSCCEKVPNRDDGRLVANEGDKTPGSSLRWRVRPMRFDDIDRCLEIWHEVELTEAHVTVASELRNDPDGFYVAELESTGEVVGMCSGVMARDDTAFMGFYAVTPRFQGIGIGRELWARTTARLDFSTINTGLYGVPDMSLKYKKAGFELEDSTRMLIFESEPGAQLDTSRLKSLQALQDERSLVEVLANEQVCNEQMLNKLIDYDRSIVGYSRRKLLRNYLLEAEEHPVTVALISRPASRTFTGGEDSHRSFDSDGNSCCHHSGAPSEAALSDRVKSSLSVSEIKSSDGNRSDAESRGEAVQTAVDSYETARLLGYGCIRNDNTGGGMIGPLYADSEDACEVILKTLIEQFDMKPAGKYSVLSLTSNHHSDRLLRQIGLQEMDQCSRMFTKFIPKADLDRIYYIHSPNFSLF